MHHKILAESTGGVYGSVDALEFVKILITRSTAGIEIC